MPEEIYDLVIVGGGPGGLTAGIYAMRAALKTVLIEKGVHGGQVAMSAEVENYPGFENIGGAELSQKFLQHAESYGLEMVGREVLSIEPGLKHHTVRLDNDEIYRAHAVIIGTGGNPRQLNVPGEESNYGKGISYCGVCDGFFFRNKNVAVIGGGDTAAEEALYLSKLATQVYMIHRRDALRAGMILQKRIKKECKIEMVWDTIVTEIKAGDEGVNGVALENVKTGEKKELPVDGVFIFVGFEPNNGLVPKGIQMNAEGYVMTNEKCGTDLPGIYVIGDLRAKYARQIVISAADGSTAALAAAHYVESKKATDGDECQLPT